MLLLDLLQLLQLVSLLAQWAVLHPRWPYLPLVVFQLINMASSNVQQVCVSVPMYLCSCWSVLGPVCRQCRVSWWTLLSARAAGGGLSACMRTHVFLVKFKFIY